MQTLILILLVIATRLFVVYPFNSRIAPKALISFRRDCSPVPISLERELERFFESTSRKGINYIATLSVKERAEVTQRALFIEDEIIRLTDKLAVLSDSYMSEQKDTTKKEMDNVYEELRFLKQDYSELLIGSQDSDMELQ